MATTQVRSSDTCGTGSVGRITVKLEVIHIPVSDLGRQRAPRGCRKREGHGTGRSARPELLSSELRAAFRSPPR
jgi:hypothetical protein